MLYKSTLRLLVVETNNKHLLVPIVTNSYKKTLWLLKHREPTAVAVGVVEGPFDDINFMHVGEIDIPTLHSQILRTTNAIYTSIGKPPMLPNCFTLDYSLDLNDFIIQYSAMLTPDELLVVLGISHHKVFKAVAYLVVTNAITYTPVNGPGKWGYYDYYWLNEKYRGGEPKSLDIKPYINRPNLQIKARAHAVGFSNKVTRKIVNKVRLKVIEDSDDVTLSAVQRDYMISQISNVISNITKKDEL